MRQLLKLWWRRLTCDHDYVLYDHHGRFRGRVCQRCEHEPRRVTIANRHEWMQR